jgi:energy-coupling factor transport system substrate-specific component
VHASTGLVTPAAPSTPRNLRWRVVDIVVASVIGVASGLVFVVWNAAYNPLSGLLEPLLPGLGALLGGGWLFAGVLGGLLIRKPGAALYAELLAAVVSTLIGNQWGPLTLVSGVVQGVGAGLALAINDLLLWYPGSAAAFATIYTVSSVVSGIVLAGLLSWLAMRGLAKTGALSRFAAGRENRTDV